MDEQSRIEEAAAKNEREAKLAKRRNDRAAAKDKAKDAAAAAEARTMAGNIMRREVDAVLIGEGSMAERLQRLSNDQLLWKVDDMFPDSPLVRELVRRVRDGIT